MFTPPSTAVSSPEVLIDLAGRSLGEGRWADMMAVADSQTHTNNILSFLEWVRTAPDRAHIHVVLPPVRRYASGTRFQRTLQSLGCTVTRKTLAYS